MNINTEKSFSLTKFCSKEGYKHWYGVFESYTFCTDKFIRVYNEQYKDDEATDAPYWNIERTNVGMFSTACWLNGWITLEEYSTEKIILKVQVVVTYGSLLKVVNETMPLKLKKAVPL